MVLGELKKYHFNPLTESDFPIVYKWVCAPHVLKWWDEESDYKTFCEKYRGIISNPLVFAFTVSIDGHNFAYIQYWFVEEDENFRGRFPKSTVGIDQFIGEVEFLGKKHGSNFVMQFSDHLLAREDVNLVITDPDPLNSIAIKCYENAGFSPIGEVKTKDGVVFLMEKSSISS